MEDLERVVQNLTRFQSLLKSQRHDAPAPTPMVEEIERRGLLAEIEAASDSRREELAKLKQLFGAAVTHVPGAEYEDLLTLQRLGLLLAHHESGGITTANVLAWGSNGATGSSPQGKPRAMAGLTGTVSLSAGTNAAYAVKADGTVWAWGFNKHGELGSDRHQRWSAPTQVCGVEGASATAGGGASGYALTEDGRVWAWGHNDHGQLGDGTATSRHTPELVQGITDVTALAAGYRSAYALRSDGTVWAWGYNHWRELGDSTATDRPRPVQVSGLSGVVAIAAKMQTAYALKSDGSVWAWGWNENSQTGHGGVFARSLVPYQKIPVKVPGLPHISAIAAGNYSAYALTADGAVWSWGCNNNGQLGHGGLRRKAVVPPGRVAGLDGVTAIAAGAISAYAITRNGNLWAWGSNEYRQIDDGSTRDRNVPGQVEGLTGLTNIVAGAASSLALRPA